MHEVEVAQVKSRDRRPLTLEHSKNWEVAGRLLQYHASDCTANCFGLERELIQVAERVERCDDVDGLFFVGEVENKVLIMREISRCNKEAIGEIRDGP